MTWKQEVDMAQATEERALHLEDETLKVIGFCLFRLYPPINPAVLLKAMRDWYLEYGAGPVLHAMLDWLSQVMSIDAAAAGSLDTYRQAQADFTQKTGLTNESFAQEGR
jgi:hypothetical protein